MLFLNVLWFVLALLAVLCLFDFLWHFIKLVEDAVEIYRGHPKWIVTEDAVDELSLEPIETGLYHPSYEGVQDSFTARAAMEEKENMNPQEYWGRESIFDYYDAEYFEPGRYDGK